MLQFKNRKKIKYTQILIIINMLRNKHTFTTQKSIVTNCQIYQYVQQQVRILLASTELKGRVVIGEFYQDQWLELKCIVPLHSPIQFAEDLVTIIVNLRFRKDNFWLTPGLYLVSEHIPSQYSYINIIEDLNLPQLAQNYPKQLIIALLEQIDKQGLEKWCIRAYQKNSQSQTININKQDVKQIHMVNLFNKNKQENMNQLKNAIKNKIHALNSMDFSNQDPLSFTNQLFDINQSRLQIENKNSYMNRLQNNPFLTSSRGLSNHNNSPFTSVNAMSNEKNNNYMRNQKPGYMYGNNIKIMQCQDSEHYEAQDHNFNNMEQQSYDNNINEKNNTFYQKNTNAISMSPFSSFKPIQKKIPNNFQNITGHNVNRSLFSQAQTPNNYQVSGFVPYRLFTSNTQTGIKKNKFVASQISNSTFNTQNLNLDIKPQRSLNADSVSNSSIQANGTSGQAQNKKQGKNPKPMNKNANLPKFLIRIFIKYVDKYKQYYVKRQYDRLYSQCKKMKEWKKNDRRQHAFGLKHLKVFFQDTIEGFPDPALNRRIISKIIGNYLLEQICQNSQIPQSHRVGYLTACRKLILSRKDPIKMKVNGRRLQTVDFDRIQ